MHTRAPYAKLRAHTKGAGARLVPITMPNEPTQKAIAEQRVRTDRIREDVKDYDRLYAVWKAWGCGYRKASVEAGVPDKRARRLWTKGVPNANLPSIVSIADGKAALAPSHAATITAPETTRRVVEEAVKEAATTAARAQADPIAEAMRLQVEAQTKLFLSSAKAIEEEAALVDNARRTSLTMLGRLVQLVKASGPMMEHLAAALSAEPDVPVPQAFARMERMLRMGVQVLELGNQAIVLRRKLMGEADAVINVKHSSDNMADMTPEEALRELEKLQALVMEPSDDEGGLFVIEGGRAAG